MIVLPMIVLGLDAGANAGFAVLEMDARLLFRFDCQGVLERPYREEHVGYLVRTRKPTLVVIEAPEGHAYETARVAHLMEAARIGGGLAGAARALGLVVVETNAQETRKAICSNGSASDDLVRSTVLMRVRGWPRKSTTHSRDAAVAGMFGALRTRVPRALGGAA